LSTDWIEIQPGLGRGGDREDRNIARVCSFPIHAFPDLALTAKDLLG